MKRTQVKYERKPWNSLCLNEGDQRYMVPFPDAEHYERTLRGYDQPSGRTECVLTVGQALYLAGVVNAYRYLLGAQTTTSTAIRKVREIKSACYAEAERTQEDDGGEE